MARAATRVEWEDGRFFIRTAHGDAELLYRVEGSTMSMYHTYTPEGERGNGIAEMLAKEAFRFAAKKRLSVSPDCSYIVHFLENHQEYRKLAAGSEKPVDAQDTRKGRREVRVKRAQSAMEYLMTYGWAILIVAVVLGALYSLGIFNGANFLGGTCIAAPGYLCSNPLMATDGTLSFTYGYQGPNVTIVGFACTNTTTAPSSFATSGSSNLEPGQEESASVSCPLSSSATIGTSYSGYLWVEYDQAGKSDLISRFATVRTSVSTGSSNFYAWCMGNYEVPGDATYSATISKNGPILAWHNEKILPFYFAYGQCTYYNGDLYCMQLPGDIGVNYDSNVIVWASTSDNTVSAWQTNSGVYPISPPVAAGYGMAGCSQYGGYVYCVGDSASGRGNTVYSAQITANGIGAWVSGANVPFTSIGTGTGTCTAYASFDYCFGSSAGNTIISAPVSGTSIGPWTTVGNLPVSGSPYTCEAYSGYIYCFFNVFSPSSANIYYAQLSGGTVGAWAYTGNIPINLGSGGSCFTVQNGYIYCGYGTTMYYAPLITPGIGSWTSTLGDPGQYGTYGLDHSACATAGDSGSYGD